MNYPDNFNRRAFDAYWGDGEGDAAEEHNAALDEWIAQRSPGIAAAIEAEYRKAFPDGPWDAKRLLSVLHDALTDAGYAI